MAHVVIVDEDAPIRQLFLTCFEAEGYQVTAADDLWAALGVLRSVLHPVVCIFNRDRYFGPLRPDDEQMAALEANRADLQRHHYIGVGWKPSALVPPRLAAIEDALGMEAVPYPLDLAVLLAAVARAAEQVSGG
jgi:CheY-like chemotaxis protein